MGSARLSVAARPAQHGAVDPGEGTQLGRFVLDRKLGRGAAGTVFLARDTLLGSTLALKVLHRDLFGDREVRERFRRELVLARRVTHPGVCRIHDLHEEQGTTFLTLEYVPGDTLAALIHAHGKLDAERTLHVLRELAPPLAAAHAAGVIHRDLKPGNIMVRDDGTVSILDFGMATAGDLQRITQAGRTVGSLRFIAPEVWEGKAATTASDLYAVGVTLYACLSGRLPYDAQTPAAMFDALKKPPPSLCEIAEAHPAVEAVVKRAMARDPKKRYGSIEALVVAFAQAVREARGGMDAGTDEPSSSIATVLVRERSGRHSAPPFEPAETLVSPSPFVRAPARARGRTQGRTVGLAVAALLGVVVVGAVIAALAIEPRSVVDAERRHLVPRAEDPTDDEPRAAPAPPPAVDAEPEPAPEPTLALEPMAPRPKAPAPSTKSRVAELMERRGLRAGDVPQLDRLVDLIQRSERAGRADDARQATERALAVATAVSIDRSFVTAKQKRVLERAERAPAAQKARLFALSSDVDRRSARGDYGGANQVLNQALDLQ